MTSAPNEHPPDGDHVDPAASDEAAGQADPGPETVSPAGVGSVSEQPASGAAEQTAISTEFTPEQIDALVAERDEFLDAYRRTAADFDNFRKLSQKRLADEVARTQGSFVERLLPVLDAIDAARTQGNEHVEAVAGALYGFLEKEGLARVHPAHEPFDPNVAEAVVHEPGDPDAGHDEPVVTEVLRTGYLWQGRVIRPAMVKVAG
jgi:molecular chaperone GrpE